MTRAKCDISAAALANGVVPSHNVTTELKDIIDYIPPRRQHARRKFGYLRMWSIHPNQIVPIVGRYARTSTGSEGQQISLIAAQNKHWGPIQHAGKAPRQGILPLLHWSFWKRARSTGMTIPEGHRNAFFWQQTKTGLAAGFCFKRYPGSVGQRDLVVGAELVIPRKCAPPTGSPVIAVLELAGRVLEPVP